MDKKSGKVTLVISPDVEASLAALKKERYADRTSSEMIRDLIDAGIRANKQERRREGGRVEMYQSPAAHLANVGGPLGNDQIAQLSDERLEAYLREHGFWKSKRLYRANGNYILREIAGEHVLVPTGDLPGNVMITMNETCAFLWKLLQQPRTVDDLIFEARQCFEDPDGELEKHIREFVEYRMQTGHIWEVK